MNELINNDNFTIDSDGEAYISQTNLSVLCGVTPHAISQHISKTRDTLKFNKISQLHHDSIELVIWHYAFVSQRKNPVALSTYRTMAKVGAKAYVYKMAGYVINAEPQIVEPQIAVPQTLSEALRLAADLSDQVEVQRLQIEQDSPKVIFVDKFCEDVDRGSIDARKRCCKISELHLIISNKAGFSIGRNTVYEILRGMRRTKWNNPRRNEPMQTELNKKLWASMLREDGMGFELMITPKGIVEYSNLIIQQVKRLKVTNFV